MLAVDKCIEDVWEIYDKDGNGSLDIYEARKFLRDVIRESGLFSGGKESKEQENRRIKEAFVDIDTDNSRNIQKDEMKEQLAKIIGI